MRIIYTSRPLLVGLQIYICGVMNCFKPKSEVSIDINGFYYC